MVEKESILEKFHFSFFHSKSFINHSCIIDMISELHYLITHTMKYIINPLKIIVVHQDFRFF